ncbi:MAG: adenylate/guanylate cyclase domain-containing protein, partial [Desulfobacteraceae bacterium]
MAQESVSPAKKFLSALPGHSEMETIWRYLPRQLSDKILASRGKIEGVRKQVTVLFVDMQGYTPLAESLGEEVVYKLINRAYECMITPVYECEGFVQELTGDGIMALFGAPVALEDAPTRACHAALKIQEQMHRLSTEIEAEHEVRSLVRMGLHTGPVVVGTVGTDFRMDFKAVGDTVNLASRLESMAEPGSILISEATHRLVEAYVQSTFEGERAVKGKRAPQRIYRLEGLKPRAVRFDMALRRGLTHLVGRQSELETLARCYYEARQGTKRTVDIIGEAGIGKSRLVHELRQQLEGEHCFFLQGYCTAYGKSSSFLPFIEVARTSFNLFEDSNQEEVEGKLRRGMELLGMQIDESLPFLLSLLGQKVEGEALRGLDAEIIGARTREVLRRLLRERCRLSPVLMLIDDMHWIDKASEELLLRIVESEECMPLLLICAYRPHYRSPWSGASYVEELHLEPLTEDSSVRLVQRRLGTEDLPRELERLVVDKAEGNPLFIEEITRYLLERRGILGKASGISSGSSEEAFPIPATLHDMLM